VTVVSATGVVTVETPIASLTKELAPCALPGSVSVPATDAPPVVSPAAPSVACVLLPQAERSAHASSTPANAPTPRRARFVAARFMAGKLQQKQAIGVTPVSWAR